MQQDLLNAPVLRDDGVRGIIVAGDTPDQFIVKFDDGKILSVAPDALVHQGDGSYRLTKRATGLLGTVDQTDQVVIPVVAEELIVEKEQIVRGKVRVHKRIETREEVVHTPIFQETVDIVRIPINRYIDDVVPEVREEEGVLVIPIIEEVVVTSKRLFLREEVRVRKKRAEKTDTQTVTLRREVVEVEREEVGDHGQRERKP